ncbi:Hcp family type VI secretion system effector [Pseudoduganella violaceinigra]|uniref:Hcp family type VI secretion system effector n=1 Tax=Pseudoduganella violaceinigra TaxID=246602 RepID=UPI000486D0B3|nr:type VI secretion system tube protein Hcp [Pseudoduganella violaceinigra]
MAIDVYLQIDGIKGESADSRHQGWIECTSVQLGVKQPKSATASTAGGHTAERCEHKSIAIGKLADLSSPILMQTCSAGRTIPKAKLEFMRADGNGDPVKYYEIELENVLVGSVDQVVHSEVGLQESLTLKFSKVHWKYTQQKIGGGIGGNTTGGWDLSTNRVV